VGESNLQIQTASLVKVEAIVTVLLDRLMPLEPLGLVAGERAVHL
jgi:hypothetical protein